MTNSFLMTSRVNTEFKNGISSDLFNVPNTLGVGVYNSPYYFYNFIPQPAGSVSITTFQTAIANVPIPLSGANTSIINGVPLVELDCERGIFFEPLGLNTFGLSGTVSVVGYNTDLLLINESIPFLANQFFAESVKTYKYIISITSNITINNVGTSTSNLIGLPFYTPRNQYIFQVNYNQVSIGTANLVLGNNWRLTTPSLTTVDSRGAIDLTNIFVEGALLCVFGRAYGADSYLQAQLLNNNLSAQTTIYSASTQNPIVNNPILVATDLTGKPYPGNVLA